jgi:hypothetical protein
MMTRFIATAAALLATVAALLAAVPASAATTQNFRATFVDIYSQCPISPPTGPVFCGDGTVAGLGHASSKAFLTGPLMKISGTDCFALTAVRTITLADGDSLTLSESGTKCPPSDSAYKNAQGNPYTVAKTFTIAGGTGIFAGATGSGTDINRSAGNSQVSVISGTITLP